MDPHRHKHRLLRNCVLHISLKCEIEYSTASSEMQVFFAKKLKNFEIFFKIADLLRNQHFFYRADIHSVEVFQGVSVHNGVV